MLECVFSNSAAGGLKVAQHCGDGGCIGAVGSIFCLSDDGSVPTQEEYAAAQKEAEEKAKRRWENAVSIGGNHEDVFCFPNDLSIGDISGDCLSQDRVDSLSNWLSILPDDRAHSINAVKESRANLDKLLRRAQAGEGLRIWYSEQPYEACGLCWLISELKKHMDALPRMTAIKLPGMVEEGSVIRSYQGWGEVCPEEFHKFLHLEQEIIPAFVVSAWIKWQELQKQNTPLRAVINGTLQGVPENFYDSFFEMELSHMEDEFQEAVLIGGILGKYRLGIGDCWVALRIETMIANGRLTPITEPKPGDGPYRRMLKKSG